MAGDQLSQIRTAVEQYVAELEKIDIHPEQIILYGSHAKGSAKSYSDIDLVVIAKDLEKWPGIERLQILSRATLHVDAPLEVLGYTPREIAQHGGESIFWEEISRSGKEIYKKTA